MRMQYFLHWHPTPYFLHWHPTPNLTALPACFAFDAYPEPHPLKGRPVLGCLGHAAYGKVDERRRAVYGKLRALVVLYDGGKELRHNGKRARTRGQGKEERGPQGVAPICEELQQLLTACP